jgi:hypothetical protein
VSGAVLPEHRPTLADLLRSAPRRVVWGLAALVAVVVLALAALLLRSSDDGVDYVQRSPIEFNFRYPATMQRVAPESGELVRLERRRNGLFLDSYAISPLRLPRHEGDVAGLLPLFADGEIAALKRRFADFELAQEGKARINQVPGYEVVFRARLGDRRLYGRLVLLPEPTEEVDPDAEETLETAGSRRGVRLLLLGTPASGAGKPTDVGAGGQLKTPYRTFRFGTEKP